VANIKNAGDRATKWIHWAARGIGSLVAALWLFVGVVSAMYETGPRSWEDTVMAGLMITSVLGVLIAWWREGIGGTIVVICGVAHSTFAYVVAGHNRLLAVLVSGGPFLLIGILFLTSWWRTTRRRVPQSRA